MHPEIYPERVNRLFILPVGFALLVMSISMASDCAVADSAVSTACSPKQIGKTAVVEPHESSTTALNRQSQYRYSPSTPLTDTYPSVCLCAKSFAARIANGIRENNQFKPQTKFPIELATEIQITDNTYWQSSEKFITDFKNELEGQFPAGTFVVTPKTTTKAETDANNPEFKTLAIHFVHTASKKIKTEKESPAANEADLSGSILANWSIGDTMPSKITMDYMTKSWVATDRNWSHNHPKSFGFYQSGYFKSKVIGFSSRRTRSPEEASSLAMQNAVHFNSLHYGSDVSSDDLKFEVVDRFQQKLSTPNGERWQAAVIMSVSQKNGVSGNPKPSAPTNSMRLLLTLMAGTFGVIWISSLLFKAIF